MATQKKTDFDITIVGGGLVGSALACALGESGRSVLVLESGTAQSSAPRDYDLRVSAITGASVNFFRAIGVWEDIRAVRMGEVREMRIWDEGGSGSLHLDAADTPEPCLAYIVENSVIRAVLYKRLQSYANIDYRDNTQVAMSSVEDRRVNLKVGDGQVSTQLVVGADGARSAVREWAQIPVSGWSFEQTAIVATINSELSHNHTAYQRFLQTGPLAFLPLDDPYTSSIVWSADTGRAKALQELPDPEFVTQLESAFEDRLGKLQLLSRRASFPLSMMHVENTVQHRMVLVGDAAHRVHPLAGQGLNLGLADVAALAEVLSGAAGDSGALRVLRQYERWRSGDTRLMVKLMDLFKRVYGSQQPLVQGLRNFGMDLVDANGPVKRLITGFASGVRADTPSSLKR